MKHNDITIVIPIKYTDFKYIEFSLPYIRENVSLGKFVVISSEKLRKKCEKYGLDFINEDEVLKGLSFSAVKSALQMVNISHKSAGWYLQQFIKLGYSLICNTDYYLCWDADMVPLRKIELFDKKNRPYFTLKKEFVEEYFYTMKNLLNLNKIRNESFIAEHMIFKTSFVKEFIQDIEMQEISGNTFWKKIINSTLPISKKQPNAFSEYETYATYVMLKYPNHYITRKLKMMRLGKTYLGENPSKQDLIWVSKCYDTISFEHWDTENFSKYLTKLVKYIISFNKYQKYIYPFLSNFKKDRLNDFNWEYGNITIYEQYKKDKKINNIIKCIPQITIKDGPLVTIITASYNLIDGGRKDWFIQNMESVQNQTYRNVEHIVIDGASKDGTIELLEEYQQKGWIKYYSEPDKGIYDAMNKGIMKAKGKYVVCLNSDDFYCNNRAIEMLVQKAEELDADACYGNAIRIHPTNDNVLSKWDGKESFRPWINGYPCHQTFLIKTDVMKDLGLYDLKYKVSADNCFFTKMVNNDKKIVNIDTDIISFRDGGFSNSHLEVAKQDQINGLFENYGQYHQLTRLDCANLVQNNFLSLPLDEAIKLGSKLEKPEWIEQYFTILAQHRNFNTGGEIESRKQKIKYKLFNFIPLMKIKKDVNKMKVKLFGFLPLFSYKQKGGRSVYKILGLPFFKIRRMENGITTKYYILGIPVMKVSKKNCY